jgi:hypothetical protein
VTDAYASVSAKYHDGGAVWGRWQAPMFVSIASPRPELAKSLKINGVKVYYFQSIAWKLIHRHAERVMGNKLSALFSICYLSSDLLPLGESP